MNLSARFNGTAEVPRGAINPSATAPIQRAGDCHNAGISFVDQCAQIVERPDETMRSEAIQELQSFAREVASLCPWLVGRVPEGFVGPPVSGPARLTRLA